MTEAMKFAIIAAGEGSRLVQEGVALPKPLVDLDGRPMIRRLIDIFLACDAEEISVIVNEHMTEVRRYLEGLDLPVPLHLTVKTTPSSMHSFYEVSRRFSPGKFILTTVDTVFREEDFAAYARAFAADTEADGMMAVTPYVDDEKPLYVTTDADMRITGFLDSMAPGVKYISGGIYGLTDRALPVLESCFERGVSRMRNYQRALVDAGLRLKAYPIEKIVDVDHASDIAVAREFIKS